MFWSQHLGYWGQNTSRIQNKEVYATLCLQANAETSSEKEVDFYKLLDLEATATSSEIKRAYRTKAIKHHPDRVQGDEQKRRAEILFKQIAQAYGVLNDKEQKSDYDYERTVISGIVWGFTVH